jgi:16S rRNA (uracil1498-N3)-methyltransferase
MSHIFRFIATSAGEQWHITNDELTHLSKVLRLKVGDTVEVTDARGTWARGEIASITKQLATIKTSSTHQNPRSKFPITMIMAALERATMDELIAPLTEIGIEKIFIFQQPSTAKARLQEKYLERWHKIALGSVKQCKGAWAPEIRLMKSLSEALTGIEQDTNKYFLDETVREPLLISANLDQKPSYMILGSELGFEDVERAMLVAAGFLPASLGPNILRAPTAAISTASFLALKRQLWK